MKFLTYLAAVILITTNLFSYETTTIKVATGKTYSNLAWYNLSDDAITTNALNLWDIAILVPGQNASIIINSGAGCKLWEVVGKTVDDFESSLDTVGLTTNTTRFKEWYNSDMAWSVGAFNCGLDGFENGGDFGWGGYNMSTHAISGTKLFIIKTASGHHYQIRIEDLLSGLFYFSYAELDGTGTKTVELSKKSFPDKTFGYYSLTENKSLDLDPLGWSLLFGKYMAQVDNGQGGTSPYMVNGIRLNYAWSAAKVEGVDPSKATTPSADAFSYSVTAIGHTWKKLNSSYEWELPTDLCYFVQSEDGLIWKLVFKAFSGSATGEATFEKTQVDPNTIKDNDGNSLGFFAIMPNVIDNGGTFDITYGIKGNESGSELSIYDINGIKVFSQNFDNNNFNALKVSPKLSSGMYLVVMSINGNASAQKLIVK